MPLPPITQSNISTSWCANFFTVILTTSEPCDTYYTTDGSSPINSPTSHLYVEPFTISEEGIFTVNFYSISHITLLSNLVQSQQVKIDNTPPVTTITPSYQPDGDNEWYVTLPTVTLSAVDNISGLDYIKYSWDGATFQTYAGGTLPVPGEGIHYLQVYSVDKASNKEKTQTKVFKCDFLAPTTAVQQPLDVSYIPVTISFIASDSASGYSTTYYTLDGSTPTLQSKSGSTIKIEDAGFYAVKYFSIDNAGNVESVKTASPFRVELDKETVQVLLVENFPINGKNGWYKSSPLLSILTTKPNLVSSIQYKVAPKLKPTTATYTSTVQITGTIDLTSGSFIALNIDGNTTPYVISIRGVDATKTTITDIIDKINSTINATTSNGTPINIATETGADGLAGTGYVTVTSPTGGTGSASSKIEFISPGTFDATETVFGLSIDTYPHTFPETYLYQDYSTSFYLPGSGIWNVTAIATTSTDEIAQVSKDYKVDVVAPVTVVYVIPDPNPYGFYTTSPDITFTATDDVSGVERTVYQFDNGPVFEYHVSEGPVHLPLESKQITLRYFSVDIAGNTETPHEYVFDYDFVPPTTILDINAVNLDSQNILDILFAPAQIVKYNPYTHQYDFSLTPTQREDLSYYYGWTNNLNARLYDRSTPVSFVVDVLTDVFTFLPVYTLSTEDIVRVSSTVDLPEPLLPNTDYYVISVTDTEIRLAATLLDAQSGTAIDILTAGSGLLTLVPQSPTIVVFDPIKLYLYATDDREYRIINETIASKNDVIRELTVQNNFLKSIGRIYNQTTGQPLSYRYYSYDKIYTVETFALTDVIVVDYVYSKIRETHYTTDGSTPTTLSPQGHIIELVQSGSYTIKWFSIDEAGNQESTQSLPFTIVVINRAPIVSLDIVKNTDTGTLYNPNGTFDWYKLDGLDPTLRPTLKISFSSPEVPVFNENSFAYISEITGFGPYYIEFRVLKVDATVEYISNVTQIKNITNSEIYTIDSFDGFGIDGHGRPLEDKIFAHCNILPGSGDIFSIDYNFKTKLDETLDGRVLTFGDPNSPDVVQRFSTDTSPYYYILPSGYNIQGAEQVTIVVNDLRGAQTVIDYITQISNNSIKLDTNAPTTTDDAVSGWVSTDVTVTLNALDVVPPLPPPPPYEQPSGIYRIYYSKDGSFPNVLFFNGSTGQVIFTLSGQYVVKYRSFDNAGNDEVVKTSAIIQIDKIAPVTSVIVSPPDGLNGWYKTAPSIVLSAVDSDSGVHKTYYKWDQDVSFTEYVASILIPSEGIHTLYFYSDDNVGNVEVTQSHVFKLDTVAPVTTDNITGSWTNNQVITFTVTDVSSGAYRTYYNIASYPGPLPDPTLSSPYTETQQITVSVSGVYQIKYFSVDRAGNQEAVQAGSNIFYLDLSIPVVTSVDPPDLIFTTQTFLTVNFADSFSGMDVNSIKIVVDDIEYSTSKNPSFFSYSGVPPYNTLQCQVGPIASIPNFDNLESAVIYGKDVAGNLLRPVVITVPQPDVTPPYIRGFWPKNGADDVSRNTNVIFLIDDDVSGVDLRSVNVDISGIQYKLNTTDVLTITYVGLGQQVFLNVSENRLYITVDGIVVIDLNLALDDYATVKKVATAIASVSGFTTNVLDRSYDQLLSIDFVNEYYVPINLSYTMAVATFEDNININYMPRNRGYLIAVTPNETFDDGATVTVNIDAADFSGHTMATEQYSFICKDIDTPSRNLRNEWYQTHVDIVNRIKSNLESTYNRNTDSTAFHGYFRALALEIAKAQQQIEDYRDDVYYKNGTTRPELLYQNMGYLVKTPPQPQYTHEQYRTILLAIMQMLFNGSTKASILEGMAVFLDVYSLSLHASSIQEYTDLVRQFTFTFDVTVGDEPIRSWEQFNSSVEAVLSLVKPAHTYFLIRYLFAEIIRTNDIIDEIVKWDFHFYGSEDVRTNCADKYKIADIITEDVSDQFDGSENCCVSFYKPILSWDELTITSDPSDIQVTASGGPIAVTSVDGFSGTICFDRNPASTETVEIIYKFNKFVIYRKFAFYTNTYTITGGNFDTSQPYLLNQINAPHIVIAYNIPEQMHAHICETGIFIDVHYAGLNETWTSPEEEIHIFDVVDYKDEDVKLDITEKYNLGTSDKPIRLREEQVEVISAEKLLLDTIIYELVSFSPIEFGTAIETNAHPLELNDPNSLLNDATDLLFFLIERTFS